MDVELGTLHGAQQGLVIAIEEVHALEGSVAVGLGVRHALKRALAIVIADGLLISIPAPLRRPAFGPKTHLVTRKSTTWGVLFLKSSIDRVTELSLKYRIALGSQWQGLPLAGGLMSYSPDIVDNFARSALYVDRIFRGAKPADLPVELPNRVKLILNMQTAKALGLVIPQSVLLRADQVIE